MPEEKLARGWIRTAAGIYQHLHTRVCSWLPPYIRKCEDTYDQHKPAARFGLALDRDEKPARRRRQSCEIVVCNSEQKDEAASKVEDNWLPESLAWIGLQVKGKSPVNLLNELGFTVQAPTPVYCDNTAAKTVAENPVMSKQLRHVARRHFFVQDVVAAGHITVPYVASDANLADGLTKLLTTAPRFEWAASRLRSIGSWELDSHGPPRLHVAVFRFCFAANLAVRGSGGCRAAFSRESVSV